MEFKEEPCCTGERICNKHKNCTDSLPAYARSQIQEESKQMLRTMERKDFNKIDRLIQNVEELITEMGWSEDINFKDTPLRFVKWLLAEQYLPKEGCRETAKKHLKATFPTKNEQMVVVGPSKVFGMCPHHLQVIEYDVWIGYIPKDKAVGLSKLSRVPEAFGQYPFIQEDFSEEIADSIIKNLQPRGVMVVVKGVHNCMRVRGVKQPNAVTMTSAIRGVFEKPPKGKDPRTEMLKLIELQK